MGLFTDFTNSLEMIPEDEKIEFVENCTLPVKAQVRIGHFSEGGDDLVVLPEEKSDKKARETQEARIIKSFKEKSTAEYEKGYVSKLNRSSSERERSLS